MVDSDFALLGMVVVALIAVVLTLVNGFVTGRFFSSLESALRGLIDNEPLTDAIEARIAQWSPEKRRYATSFLNVIDPYTNFEWTDLDDDIKAELRDWFDGVVEVPDEPIVEATG